MIKVERDNGFYDICQVCHREETIYDILASDGRNGTEIHLCRACCKELRSLLKFTQKKDVKMVSIEELD